MPQSNRDNQTSVQDVALIVGGGPGISSSCGRLFAESGMRVGVAARNPEKAVLEALEKTHGVRRYACDASGSAFCGLAQRLVGGAGRGFEHEADLAVRPHDQPGNSARRAEALA